MARFNETDSRAVMLRGGAAVGGELAVGQERQGTNAGLQSHASAPAV